MEIRIGVRDVAREVTFESDSTPEQVRSLIAEALSSGSALIELQDDKGGTVLVPAAALGYVEIGSPEKGRVGFGSH
ncbi:DUF3107 domain-containing protein [Ornithinimicrobium avium]|uniref:DUF3107 domain-containing protein n=1 Tax=Ornithinimicrobium avium TaxID=2283195 RepID=A0A345NRJ5_9MICO|nr:DUF3107 domain-containing protein [Ornithinimicrobium avium]AXH97653.1 DUF3107 domain-containing protein [Ornithinimicrobium avium]